MVISFPLCFSHFACLDIICLKYSVSILIILSSFKVHGSALFNNWFYSLDAQVFATFYFRKRPFIIFA